MADLNTLIVEKLDALHFQLLGLQHAVSTVSGRLDRLIMALAEEDEESPSRTLDGEEFPNAERDQTQSL